MGTKEDFDHAVAEWTREANRYVDAQEKCRVEHAAATLRSTGKNATEKKAEADIDTANHRLARNRIEVAKTAAYHRMIFARGIHGEMGGAQ